MCRLPYRCGRRCSLLRGVRRALTHPRRKPKIAYDALAAFIGVGAVFVY